MSDLKISDIVGDISSQRYNPTAVVLKCIDAVEKALDGSVTIVDASSPFMASIEAGVCTTVAFMQENATNTRRLYPVLAQTQEDLYRHMADIDYVGRFATPPPAEFYLFFSKKEIIDYAIPVADTNYSMLVIPRNTVFTVSEVPFSIEYPIEIRIYDHGGFQVVYDTSKESPLFVPTSNLLEYGIASNQETGELIYIKIPTQQFFIESIITSVSASNGHKTDIDLVDFYYYTRCYVQNASGQWSEIKTTHSEQVYDPLTLTAVLDVREKSVRVIIPPVYTTTGMISGKLRIDVYQTKADISMELSNYLADDFVVDWRVIDKNEESIYISTLRNLPTFSVLSQSSVSGGTKQTSFESLKEKVIANAVGKQLLPITNAQIAASFENKGFTVVKNLDTVTNRIFLASKPMPESVSNQILTPISSAMVQANITLKELQYAYGVYTNGDIVTMTSRCLYETVDGITKPIGAESMTELMSLGLLERCAQVNQNKFYYSPFTYVLDATGANFGFRAYHIDSPERVRKNFVAENATTGLQASVASNYSVDKTNTGYVVRIMTSSNTAYKSLADAEVSAQMIIHPQSQDSAVYVPGVLTHKTSDGERVYSFTINTNWLIDSDHCLEISNTFNSTHSENVRIKLESDFDIYFTSSTVRTNFHRNSTMDSEIFTTHLPESSFAIAHDKIRLKLGTHLQGLWCQSRSALSSVIYKVYANDVPAIYTQDVYSVDPVTGLSFKVGPDGKLIYTKIASKGDPKLDSHGQPIMAHLQGEQVLDEEGNPTPIDGYEQYLSRFLDLFVFEGVYYFATDSLSASYKQQVVSEMLQWITKDIPNYDGHLLDQTKIYYYPLVTAGQVKVVSSNNEQITINSEQRLKVRLYVKPNVFTDMDLRKSLSDSTIRAISQKLNSPSISVSAIEYHLRDIYRSNVLDVKISGFGGSSDLSQMTLMVDHSRLSIMKKLTALPDNTVIVEENIDIEFIKHGSDS